MAGSNGRGIVPSQPPAAKPPQLTEETLKNLLDVQSKELELRSKEMDLRIRELDNNTAHAEKILHTQERDRESERKHIFKRDMVQYALIGAGIVALVLVVLVGMYLNKDALVSDVLKIVSGAVLGALGGYGLGRSKRQKDAEEE